MVQAPLLSIIIPVYNSHDTVGGTLKAFQQQTFTDYEIIVVDSGPSDQSESIICSQFPQVRYFRSATRLYPHEARNYGTRYASSNFLVFTDPDAYPKADWLEQLWKAHDLTGHAIISAVACYGTAWKNKGIHFAKFDKWLPGGLPRSIDIGPTVGIFCPRTWFDEVGGFPDNPMLGDTAFSWTLTEHGYTLWFLPTAITEHHHTQSYPDFVRERFNRGREFGYLRIRHGHWTRLHIFAWLVISLVPVRLAKLLRRSGVNARQAGSSRSYILTLPINLLGQTMWLLGESRAYLDSLLQS